MSAGMDYLGVWRPGAGAQWWVTGWSYEDFKAKDKEHFDQGLRLVCLRVRNGKFTGVWHPGTGAQWWTTGASYDDFKAKDKGYFDQGLRLVDIEIQDDGKFTGVWRPGSGAQWWTTGASYDDFKAKDKGYFDQGLRLVCLRLHGGKFTGVWHPGTGAQWWTTGAAYSDFKTQDKGYFDQGLRLVDLEVHDGKFTGVWRPGSGAQWWSFGNDYEMMVSRDHGYFTGGLRLTKVFPYTGACDSGCLNQVVMPTGSYNYGITRTAEHCPGLPGTCGTPAPTDVVFYRWPNIDFDGTERFVRLSALEGNDRIFTLPFSDTAVRRGGTWLYSPGSWHHAIDFSRGDGQTFKVLAAAPGRVIFIGWDNWSGNTIVISHDAGGAK
ncbi:MAG: M23 family metallopeptidase, partial [Bryobacteraceae bacterium]